MPSPTRERYEGPSFRLRAALAVTLLVGFYLLMLVTALALAAAPIVMFLFGGKLNLVACLLCWVASALVLSGTVAASPRFRPRGRRLSRSDAPRLFEVLDELAERSGIEAPDQVFLSALPEAAVTQTGGLFRRGERILRVGLPLLDALTVAELRAVVAHEYGHFAGGDTRLLRLASRAHDLFATTLGAAEGGPFAESPKDAIGLAVTLGRELASAIAQIYARVYFRIALGMSRREESAADRLAARVAGREAMISALERMPELDAYRLYLANDVALVMKRFVMPSDLLAGFRVFRARFFQSAPGQEVLSAHRAAPTSAYDSHPSLSDRIGALRALPDPGVSGEDDGERAIRLLADVAAMEEWLAFETQPIAGHVSGLRNMPWAEIGARVYAPEMHESARRVAAEIHPVFPAARTMAAMFASVVRALDEGRVEAIARAVEPAIATLPGPVAARAVAAVVGGALSTLFQGALLERGATVAVAIGEGGGPQIVFEGAPVDAERLAAESMVDAEARGEVARWAARLSTM